MSEQHTARQTEASNPGNRTNLFRRLLPLLVLVTIAVLVYSFDLHKYLTFESLREHREALLTFVNSRAVEAGVLFMVIYAVSTAVSLPGGAALSITGGFLFGGWLGCIYVVIGATVGATALFIAARTLLGDALRRRAGPWLSRMEAGFQENALSYLLFLRLIPAFPFFVVNLVPAFLGVPLRTYVLGTAVGIIPGALVFTFAGAGIGSVLDSGETFSAGSVLTPEIITALVGLGILALLPVAHKYYKARRDRSRTD